MTAATNRITRGLLARGVVPIVCLAVGCGALVQVAGSNERSHYAQARAFSTGTPIIDPYFSDTGDRGYYRGHFYSDKAPGLAFLTMPVYVVAKGVGLPGPPESRAIHVLAIFGSLIPGALLLLMISGFVKRFEPRAAVPVALMLGLGTLLLPFSTVLFSHVLAACLGFAAYYLLWLGKRSSDDLTLICLAGLFAGLAVTTEYPLAILAGLLGAYAIGRRPVLRRPAAYGAGLLAGLVPLAIYNWWAFGSPLRISYANVSANHAGLFGLVGFDPHAALQLLFGARGLLTATPVLAVAVVGIVMLYRDGHRGEAAMAVAVGCSYLIYNASYYLPFGGLSPGPRFLIVVIPFLGLPLAVALRRLPALTLSLAVASAAMMIAATLTVPELVIKLPTSIWWDHLVHGQFTMPGAGGEVLWFGLFATAAVLIVVATGERWPNTRSGLVVAIVGVAAWVVIADTANAVTTGWPSALAIIAAAASLVVIALADGHRALAARRFTQARRLVGPGRS